MTFHDIKNHHFRPPTATNHPSRQIGHDLARVMSIPCQYHVYVKINEKPEETESEKAESRKAENGNLKSEILNLKFHSGADGKGDIDIIPLEVLKKLKIEN